MSSSEFEAIHRRIAALERRASLEKRSGTVTDVDATKGIRIDWGPGSDGKPLKSPWIKQSAHHGVIVENKPFKVGQTVISHGMDPEHLTALVFPHSESDNNPADGNRSLDHHTYRIRKPPDPNAPPDEKAKDDKDDLTYARSYNNFDFALGEKLSRKALRDLKKKKFTITDTIGKDDTVHVAEIDQDKGHTHSVNKGKHQITIHPSKGIQHSASNGDHKITLDDSGITHETKKSITKSAKETITDTAKKILHNGDTKVLGNLGISKLLSAVGGMNIGGGGIGAASPGFSVDPFGNVTLTLKDFPDDVAAENGGVELGQLYRTDNVVKVLTRLPSASQPKSPTIFDDMSGLEIIFDDTSPTILFEG
jgi:hypothetical protein